MPLSELLRLIKPKPESSPVEKSSPSTDASAPPENIIVELVWEDGQISLQSQSNRTRDTSTSSSLPSHIWTRIKDLRMDPKMEKYGAMTSVLNEVSMSVPSDKMGLSEEDDMVPWFNYPTDDSLQAGCRSSDFLAEVSASTVNEHQLSVQNTFLSCDKQSYGNWSTLESHPESEFYGLLKEPTGGSSDARLRNLRNTDARLRSGIVESSSPYSTHQIQTSLPFSRSLNSESNGDVMSYSGMHHATCAESGTSAGSFTDLPVQKQDPIPTYYKSGSINFSHFLLPALARTKGKKTTLMGNSGSLGLAKMGTIGTGTTATSRIHTESTQIESNGGLRKEIMEYHEADAIELESEAKAHKERPVTAGMDDSSDRTSHSNPSESTTKGDQNGEKAVETVVACSSVCSGNSWGRAFDDLTDKLKRKRSDVQDSDCHSEDVEEESIEAKRAAVTHVGTGSKRSRSAEVHNLSERRRRDRINEKMRALQELIPNCNKVDKASMLDEAIEYLKTLQLQVEMMSMGAGYYMPPMMLPGGIPHMHLAHMAHFPQMGVGRESGMGFGIGVPDMSSSPAGCSMFQVPPVPGPQFPSPSQSMTASLSGIGPIPIFGHLGQRLPMSMPRVPLVPGSVGAPVSSAMQVNGCGLEESLHNLDSAKASSSKDLMKNVSLQLTPSIGHNNLGNLTSDQGQAMTLKQSDGVGDVSQGPEANGSVA